MAIIKRKNKKFDYQPRFYDDKGEGNVYKFKGKFDNYRSTLGSQGGIKNRANRALEDLRAGQDKAVVRRIVIIIAVLLFLFLYIIDFDLSIFSFSN